MYKKYFYLTQSVLAPGDFLAGGCAGVSVDAVLFPLDTLKTRLQARRAGLAPPAAPSGRNLYSGLGVNSMGSFLSSGGPQAATALRAWAD